MNTQSLIAVPNVWGFDAGKAAFYEADLSELNDMCDDKTNLSARDLSPRYLQQLLDAYFLHHHSQPYSFFHEDHLRQATYSGSVPDHLISAIAAIAIRFATNNDPQTRVALAFSRSSWASIAQLDMDAEGEFDVEVVQSLSLLAIFEYTGARLVQYSNEPRTLLIIHRSKAARRLGEVWPRYTSRTSIGATP